MLYIKICYFTILTLVMLKCFFYLLNLLQQSHYHIKQFISCFPYYFFFKKNVYILYLLIVISLINNIYLYIVGLILAFIFFLLREKVIKKLKFTKRIIRLLLTYSLILIFGLLITKDLRYLSFIYLLNPFVIIIVSFINLPVETIIQKHYIHQAQKKLIQLDTLVKVGITGSYGKTSTKNIITTILENSYLTLKTPASYNTIMGITKVINNQLNKSTEVFVCEMGASKLGEIGQMSKLLEPHIRVITDVGYQHISTFKSIENVLKAKFELVNGEKNDFVTILNGDNELIKENSQNMQNVIYYGFNKQNTYNAQNIEINQDQTSFDLYYYDNFIMNIKTNLLGEHNIKNILASYAITISLKRYGVVITNEEFKQTIKRLQPTNHRLSYKQINNLHIYDDAFSANIVGIKNSVDVVKKTNYKKIIITPGIVDSGKMTKQLNEEVASYIQDVFDDIYIIDNDSGRVIYNKLKDLSNIYLYKSFSEAYTNVVNNNLTNEVALLIANDLPDNYLVRRKKNDKKDK